MKFQLKRKKKWNTIVRVFDAISTHDTKVSLKMHKPLKLSPLNKEIDRKHFDYYFLHSCQFNPIPDYHN